MVPDSFGEWFRWGVGVLIVALSGMIAHLYSRIDGINKDYDKKIATDLAKIWGELARLRQGAEDDRQRTADSRATMAASIVTRDEMDRQFGRMVSTMNTQIAAISRTRGRPGSDIAP